MKNRISDSDWSERKTNIHGLRVSTKKKKIITQVEKKKNVPFRFDEWGNTGYFIDLNTINRCKTRQNL